MNGPVKVKKKEMHKTFSSLNSEGDKILKES